jgi:hypothetical protein
MSDQPGSRTVEEVTTGHVPDLLTEVETEGSTPLIETKVDILMRQVKFLVDAVNGRMSFGDGKQSSRVGNLDGVNVQYTFNAVAVVEAIPHNLGRKPVGYVVADTQWAAIGTNPPPIILSCGSNGDPLYGGGDNRITNVPTDWDNRLVYFRLAGANTNWLPALFRIWLF